MSTIQFQQQKLKKLCKNNNSTIHFGRLNQTTKATRVLGGNNLDEGA